MTFSNPNRSPATLTKNRVKPAPGSGICVTCLDSCPGPCEIGRSAIRGREMLYPQPFGNVTAGADKDYPVDFSHFNIQGTCVGAVGVKPDSDVAIFPAVDVSAEIGVKDKVKLSFPAFTGALGSTEIARPGDCFVNALTGLGYIHEDNYAENYPEERQAPIWKEYLQTSALYRKRIDATVMNTYSEMRPERLEGIAATSGCSAIFANYGPS